MGFFSSNSGFTDEEREELEFIQRNGGVNFIGIGRSRRIAVSELRGYDEDGGKTLLKLKSGEEIKVDIKAEDLDEILGMYRIGNIR